MHSLLIFVKMASSKYLSGTLNSVNKCYIWESLSLQCHLMYRILFPRCRIINQKKNNTGEVILHVCWKWFIFNIQTWFWFPGERRMHLLWDDGQCIGSLRERRRGEEKKEGREWGGRNEKRGGRKEKRGGKMDKPVHPLCYGTAFLWLTPSFQHRSSKSCI